LPAVQDFGVDVNVEDSAGMVCIAQFSDVDVVAVDVFDERVSIEE
jgi:hypothetical protein